MHKWTVDIPATTTEDLKALMDEIKQELNTRRRDALRRFRKANPVLGMSLCFADDNDAFLGFWYSNQQPPQWVLQEAMKADVGSKIVRIYSPQLMEALIEGGKDKATVHFDSKCNTSSNEEWVDLELDMNNVLI